MAIRMYPEAVNDRALLIEWNTITGERAGHINPNDPNLQCYGWQNMDIDPAVELRVIEDNRDLSQYEDVPGVTTLEGKDVINTAIDNNFPDKYSIDDQLIYEEHVKQEIDNSHIIIGNLPDDRVERLKKFKNDFKIKGIRVLKPRKLN
jgi:hypothetical protein